MSSVRIVRKADSATNQVMMHLCSLHIDISGIYLLSLQFITQIKFRPMFRFRFNRKYVNSIVDEQYNNKLLT